MITELRRYRIKPDRVRRKDAFYGSDWWLERETWAMDHVLEYDVTFLDAALVRQGGDLSAAPWPAQGEPAGSTPDDPPEGWLRSPRATFVRATDR